MLLCVYFLNDKDELYYLKQNKNARQNNKRRKHKRSNNHIQTREVAAKMLKKYLTLSTVKYLHTSNLQMIFQFIKTLKIISFYCI